MLHQQRLKPFGRRERHHTRVLLRKVGIHMCECNGINVFEFGVYPLGFCPWQNKRFGCLEIKGI